MSRFLKQHGLTLGYAGLIFFISSIPSLQTPTVGIEFGDKLLHAGEYTVFGFLLMRSGHFLFLNAGYPALIGILYGGLDEIHQRWVFGRHADEWDFLADAIGIVVGIWIYKALTRQKKVSKILTELFKNFIFLTRKVQGIWGCEKLRG